MKKTLIALAVLGAAAGVAHAQSNVTIYGVVDTGYIKQNGSDVKMGENVNSRIQLLFGEEYGIRLYSVKNCGTDVRVLLPKVTKDNINEKRIPENRKRD